MTADKGVADRDANSTQASSATTGGQQLVNTISSLAANVSKPQTASGDGIFTGFVVNDGMLMRVTYVLLGLTFILVVYFGVKFWRLRRRKSNIRRYDILTTQRVATDIGIESGSDDELFDDAQAKLVRGSSGVGVGAGRNVSR